MSIIDVINKAITDKINSFRLEAQQKENKNISINKIFSFFHTKKEESPQIIFLNALKDNLNLRNNMTIQELGQVIVALESIQVVDNKLECSFKEILQDEHCVLESFHQLYPQQRQHGDPSKLPILPKIDSSSPVLPLLVEIHEKLYAAYEQASLHAKGELPFAHINYSQSQINQSQSFNALIVNTRQEKTADKSNIVNDIIRQSVSINSKKININQESASEEVIAAIEKMTSDKVSQFGSKANKIFNFGGQFLEAILLSEFLNTTKVVSEPSESLAVGLTKGHINWVTNKSGEPEAVITLKIFTASSELANNKIYLLGTDGKTLMRCDAEDYENLLLCISKEVKGQPNQGVVHIAEMEATVALAAEVNKTVSAELLKYPTMEVFADFQKQVPEVNHFYIKNASVKINTPDLVSIRQHPFLASEPEVNEDLGFSPR